MDCPFSGVLLDSIPMCGVVIGDLILDGYGHTISIVFHLSDLLLFFKLQFILQLPVLFIIEIITVRRQSLVQKLQQEWLLP
jgi:hypothetical protein